MSYAVVRSVESMEMYCQEMLSVTNTKTEIGVIVQRIIDNIKKQLETRFETRQGTPFTYTSRCYSDKKTEIDSIIAHYWQNSSLGTSNENALSFNYYQFRKACSHLIAERIQTLVLEHFQKWDNVAISSNITLDGYLVPESSFDYAVGGYLACMTTLCALLPIIGWAVIPVIVGESKDRLYSGSFTNTFKVTPIIPQH